MEEFILFLLLVIGIVLIVSKNKSNKERSESVMELLYRLLAEQQKIFKELEDLKQQLKTQRSSTSQHAPEPATTEPLQEKTPEPAFVTQHVVQPERIPVQEEPAALESMVAPQTHSNPIPEETEATLETEPYEILDTILDSIKNKKKAAPAGPTFWERNPDLEKFIGENLINKIGIAILVIGIGFFVKFAIDQNWIKEWGRVAIGIFCGGALIGIAHKLRTLYKAFSSVLVGGGLAVLYITIALAYQEYRIFEQPIAFALMVVITCFAVFLSMAYNRQELAVIAFIGGFISPIMLSTGQGNYIVLFSYISILNLGMLTLAYFRSWKVLNAVAFVSTVLLYGAWLYKQDADKLPHGGALLFATFFYIIFFLMAIANNIKEQRKFIVGELSMLISNTFLYYSAGLFLLAKIDHGLYQGLFTILVALFNLVFAYSLYKSRKADLNVVYLLIGLVLTFASLSAPVQLEGNHITLFWALEAVLLLWLSQKSGIQLIKTASFIVMGLMWVSLAMDWMNIYAHPVEAVPHRLFFNKGLITTLVACASLLGFSYFLKREGDYLFGIEANLIKMFVPIAFIVLLYVGMLLEVNYQVNYRVPNYDAQSVYLGIYNFAFLIPLLYSLTKQGKELSALLAVVFTILATLGYLMVYNVEVSTVRDLYLIDKGDALPYFLHYILTLLYATILLQLRHLVFVSRPFEKKPTNFFNWPLCFLLLYIVSAELAHIIIISRYSQGGYIDISNSKDLIFKVIFPILWGLCSFGFMYYGMNKKAKTIRIISLVVFTITLLKLFVFDVSQMSQGGKIAAFISLGVLLLVISFMYQKLKKLIAEDETKDVEP